MLIVGFLESGSSNNHSAAEAAVNELSGCSGLVRELGKLVFSLGTQASLPFIEAHIQPFVKLRQRLDFLIPCVVTFAPCRLMAFVRLSFQC